MSPHPPRSRPGCRPTAARTHRRAGVALVIVLAFIALLTGLIVAYFARSMTSRQLANSSASQTKSTMLARSAADIVIAGLKQEIAAGSLPAPSPAPSPVYPYDVPLAPANAVPVRDPAPAAGAPDLMPNLVRRSDHTDAAMAAPGVPSLASDVSSSTAATNGRWITSARWNSHRLIPSYDAVQAAAAGTAIAPATPDRATGFTAPDWVLVSRSGPAVQTGLGSGATALNDAPPMNGNYVIGRYAYAIYDEGGLLDMNVAGHPTPAGPPVPTTAPPAGFTATQVGQKGSLAMADLTQLPIVKNPAAPTTPAAPNPATSYLSQAFVDSLVGWRNHASANPAGAFPNFTFSASQANSWFTNFAYQNTTGFLRAYLPPSTTGTGVPTDQAILSRQQLLQLCSSIGLSANALQFMGTFSRSLEQPSYIPAHLLYPNTAPSINGVSTVTPPAASSANSYQGNNNAAGNVGPLAGQDLINPSLLTIRVAASTPQWTRADVNKTVSVPGEPLLKNKFALTRLREITYDASDTSDSVTDPSLQGANHIEDWFGLSRTANSSPWTYNHGLAGSIMTLEQVATANREPDFAELLKAAINVGSIAKGGGGEPASNGRLQQRSVHARHVGGLPNSPDHGQPDRPVRHRQLPDGDPDRQRRCHAHVPGDRGPALLLSLPPDGGGDDAAFASADPEPGGTVASRPSANSRYPGPGHFRDQPGGRARQRVGKSWGSRLFVYPRSMESARCRHFPDEFHRCQTRPVSHERGDR